MKKRALVLLALTLLAAGSSMAMSLGRHRGVALIGRPLDISILAVLDAQSDPAALCIEADAFYADHQLERSLVRISTEKALSNPLDTIIRIRSSVLVDEPVVTLMVRVGCQQKIERRYVVLADLAVEPASRSDLPSAVRSVNGPQVPLVSKGDSSAGASVTALSTVLTGVPSAAAAVSSPSIRNKARVGNAASSTSGGDPERLLVDQTVSPSGPQRDVLSAKRDGQRVREMNALAKGAVSKARLKLEPLDLSVEHDLLLKPSMELLTVPAVSDQQRSVASALWRALTAQPQDILRDAATIQTLEDSLSSLRTQAEKNQLALNELNTQLVKIRSERSSNWLVYVLGVLLIFSLAGLFYLWGLRRLSGVIDTGEFPWWRKNRSFDKGWTNNFPDSALPAPSYSTSDVDIDPSSAKTKEDHKKKSAATLVDRNSALGADESAFTEVRHISKLDSDSEFSAFSSLDFTTSMPNVARTAKAEELFDVQQQADFFVSLGQHDQAVDVLRGHIAGDTQSSPLVYLDLFNLYHQLDRQVDYEALRAEFNQLFSGKVPAFDLYSDHSAGLDAYPVVLTRIEVLWPSPKVLDVIEESILRRPVATADAFDLEAYRELLLLYAVAKDLIHPDDGEDQSTPRFNLPAAAIDGGSVRTAVISSTLTAPLFSDAAGPGTKEFEVIPSPQASLQHLDVDLSKLPEVREKPLNIPVSLSNSNSNFFARLGTKMPVGSSVRPLASTETDLPPAASDNMIDFDEFNSVVKKIDQTKPPGV